MFVILKKNILATVLREYIICYKEKNINSFDNIYLNRIVDYVFSVFSYKSLKKKMVECRQFHEGRLL